MSDTTRASRPRASLRSAGLHFGVDFSLPNIVDVPPVKQRPRDYRPGDYVTVSDVLRNGQGKAEHGDGTGRLTLTLR